MDLTYFAIGIGAIAGALGRYYITLFWTQRRGDRFPYGTLFVNLNGAFLIGVISKLLTLFPSSDFGYNLLVIGLLGSFTTFSSYILDAHNLFNRNQTKTGFLYLIGSPLLGFICLEIGIWTGKSIM